MKLDEMSDCDPILVRKLNNEYDNEKRRPNNWYIPKYIPQISSGIEYDTHCDMRLNK